MTSKVSINTNQETPIENVNPGDDIQVIESSVKELLDLMLSYFEKFIQTKEDVEAIESKLNDYESVVELVVVIKTVFQLLTKKVDIALESADGEGYRELEKVTQKYEGEIRNHIRVEQQLKLYAESLQTKLDDSEKTRTELLESTKAMINGIKRDNQKLAESVRHLKEENEKLLLKIKSFDEVTANYEEKLALYPALQARVRTLERMLYETKSSSSKGLLHSKISNSNLQHGNDVGLKNSGWDPEHEKNSLKTEVANLPGYRSKTPLKTESRNKSLSRPPSALNNITAQDDYLKVKIEITDDRINRGNARHKRLNYRGRSQNNSAFIKYKEPQILSHGHSGLNLNNSGLLGNVDASTQMNNTTSLHRRRKSTSTTKKVNNDSRSKTDLSAIYPAGVNDSWMSGFSGGQQSRYL